MSLPYGRIVREDSRSAAWALLLMRVQIGLTLFVMSGLPKLLDFGAQGDPLHLGSLATPAMAFATLALGICPLFVAVGFGTRVAALLTTLSLAATFFVIEFGPLTTNPLTAGHDTHPEVTYLYMVAFLALIVTGPGRFSVDGWLFHRAH